MYQYQQEMVTEYATKTTKLRLRSTLSLGKSFENFTVINKLTHLLAAMDGTRP